MAGILSSLPSVVSAYTVNFINGDRTMCTNFASVLITNFVTTPTNSSFVTKILVVTKIRHLISNSNGQLEYAKSCAFWMKVCACLSKRWICVDDCVCTWGDLALRQGAVCSGVSSNVGLYLSSNSGVCSAWSLKYLVLQPIRFLLILHLLVL